jgi:hypothetical protein
MKKLVLIIFLALVGFTTQAQCARCKHPKAYIEKKTDISYPCIHWYRAINKSIRRNRRSHSGRRVLFIHI